MDVRRVKPCDRDLFAQFYLRFKRSGRFRWPKLTLNRAMRLGQS